VLDPQQAAVPGVKIVATHADTGAKYETVSSAEGQYTLPFLTPGSYNITVESSGFKRYVREGVPMTTNERKALDIVLEVGQVNETVTVTAETTLLETATASTGQVITARQIENMPMNGRTPLVLAQLAFGVVPSSDPRFYRPFDNAGPSGFSMGGAPGQTNELLLDGAPDGTRNGRVAYNPPVDAVTEVKVETFMSDAAYGHTGGGTVNVVLKGGTNGLHGAAYNFNQVSKLAATPFYTNRSGQKKPVTRYNQWGVNAGGPLMIPKVIDGRNKAFWYFGYEGIKDSFPEPLTSTVPTDAERRGDFSALLALGSNYQIYDPTTGAREGTRIRRQPFAGNVVPSNRLNAIARNYLPYWPAPNQPGQADGRDNFLSNSVRGDNYNSEMGRLDFNLSERHKFFFNFRHNERLEFRGNRFFNIATGNFLKRVNWGSMVDDVFMISPTTVLNTRVNWTRFTEGSVRPSDGFNFTSLGFPASLASSSARGVLPQLDIGGFSGLGDTAGDDTPFDSFQIFSNLTKIAGKHSLKIGTDLRLARESSVSYGNSTGRYNFAANWTRGPLDNATNAPLGQEFAAFMLGMPTGGLFDVNATRTGQYRYYAFFLQDDLRLRPNLILNLGLRYERDLPTTERFDRTVNGFDAVTASPVNAASMAAYARSPIPEIPVGQFRSIGGLLFAGPGNRNVYDTGTKYFSPRFGIAWTPSRLRRTSIRSGVGVFFFPLDPALVQTGFSQQTQLVASLDSFLTPNATLSNPFPTGVEKPTGSSLGIATFLGRGISVVNRDRLNPYSIRWNVDIQREFGRNLVVEVGYIGNHSVHLPVDNSISFVPRNQLSTSFFRDQPAIDRLSALVANPFAGLIPGTNLNGATVGRSQLLVQYPQFAGVAVAGLSDGSSFFHMLQARMEKRYASGLQFLANYQWSKLLEKRSRLNAFDPLEKRIAAEDRPQRFVFSTSYDLPFGKGKAWGGEAGPLVNRLIGGWIVNGIYQIQVGRVLDWGDVIYFGGDIKNDPRNVDNAFDTSRFDTNSRNQRGGNVRFFPSRFSLRQDGANNLDVSVLKNIPISETVKLQFRCEFFNFTNHPTFNAAERGPTSSNFGKITSQANLPRATQLALRLTW